VTIPHAKIDVEALEDVSTNLLLDTPPLVVVAQQTTPNPAKGRIMDLMLKRCRIFVV
jgi:hypothetical protein